MENMFTIPGYRGTFNASKISNIRMQKGSRCSRWYGDHYITLRKNGKHLKYTIKQLEDWYDLKYLSYKLFGTKKPKARARPVGHFEPAGVYIAFGGVDGNLFEFPSNKAAKEFHDELLAMLKNMKFTCQFEK